MKFPLFVLSIFFVFIQTSIAQGRPPLKNIQDLKSFIVEKKFNGVILVMKKNKVLFKEAFGHRDLSSKIPLTVNDRFQIGSLTKQFVAAAILKLQEENRLSIDDPITKYLPEYTRWRNITIRNILNHTSGVINYTDHPEFMASRRPNLVMTLDSMMDYAHKYPVDFRPGSQFKYSNSGYIIAGKIIEVVSGMNWDQYIERKFLQPLGLKNTGHTIFFEKVSDVIGHDYNGKSFNPVRDLNLSWALSAGSFYSTLDDLAVWTEIYDSSSILNYWSKRDMLKPSLGKYGLGVFITNYGRDTLINHSGVTRGFHSKLYYLKKSKLKVITLDNSDGIASEVASVVLSFFYGR